MGAGSGTGVAGDADDSLLFGTQSKLGGAEQSVDDVETASDPIVHQLGRLLRSKHKTAVAPRRRQDRQETR